MDRSEAKARVAVLALFAVVFCTCRVEDSAAPNTPSILPASMGGAQAGGGGIGPRFAGAGGNGGAAASSAAGSAPVTGGVGGGGDAGSAQPMAGSGSAGAAAGSGAAGSGAAGSDGAQDPTCDMNGIWIARMMSVSEALGLEQCGSIYSYLELQQRGADVEIVNHFNCGIEGRGSSNGTLSDATLRALIKSNSQIGRKGTMTKAADGTCQFKMDKYWVVLGADEVTYAPSPRNADTPLTQVQASKPLPTVAAAALDFENDGQPGLAIVVAGVISGIRHGVQRSNHAWTTNERYKIVPALDWATDVEVRAEYYSEENVLAVQPEDAALLTAPSNGVPNSPSARVTLRFLGRDASDPRVAPIVASADPMADGALQTCKNIVKALPAVEAISTGFAQVCPCPGGGACM